MMLVELITGKFEWGPVSLSHRVVLSRLSTDPKILAFPTVSYRGHSVDFDGSPPPFPRCPLLNVAPGQLSNPSMGQLSNPRMIAGRRGHLGRKLALLSLAHFPSYLGSPVISPCCMFSH